MNDTLTEMLRSGFALVRNEALFVLGTLGYAALRIRIEGWGSRRRALAEGIAAVLQKPVEPSQLAAFVRISRRKP